MKEGTEFITVLCPYCHGKFEIHPGKPKEERYCEWCWNGFALIEKGAPAGLFFRIDAMYGKKE